MAKLNPESAWDFADAIKALVKQPGTRRRATVQRVDNDGTIWVSLPGSSTTTPVKSTGAYVNPGDTVLTELRGTTLHITENHTSPSIGANTARSIARDETNHAEIMAQQAQTVADEANAVAQATNQHFWADDNGAHVTDVTQEDWKRATDNDFPDYDADTKPYHNQLLNSLGILLRTALNNLVSITKSAIAFYDGQGNNASNIVARFGSDGAQIGKSGAAHSVIDANGQRFYASDGSTQLANIGYGEGASEEGTANAPYYTFGTRAANSTIGNYSVAEGYNVEASGYSSHAEGVQTTASRQYAHAEGYKTKASGNISHAEGVQTTASGNFSHAEGSSTTASGNFSHAEGSGTTASGNFSHSQNSQTVAKGNYQTAMGRYNVEDTSSTYALIIGNGTADDARSNAFAVDWTGDIVAPLQTAQWSSISTYTDTVATVRRFGHLVYITGSVTLKSALTARTAVATIPTGYRPVAQSYGRDNTNVLIVVETNGQFKLEATTAGTHYFSIMYMAA